MRITATRAAGTTGSCNCSLGCAIRCTIEAFPLDWAAQSGQKRKSARLGIRIWRAGPARSLELRNTSVLSHQHWTAARPVLAVLLSPKFPVVVAAQHVS